MEPIKKADAIIVLRHNIAARMHSVNQGNRRFVILEVNDPDQVKVIPLGNKSGRYLVDVRGREGDSNADD